MSPPTGCVVEGVIKIYTQPSERAALAENARQSHIAIRTWRIRGIQMTVEAVTQYSGCLGRSSPWWQVKQVTLPRCDAPSAGRSFGKNCSLIALVISSIRREAAFLGLASLAKSPRTWQWPQPTPSA